VQIAVEGCMHGELDKVYDTMRRLEEAEGIKIDLLICCGDFQVCSPLCLPMLFRLGMCFFWPFKTLHVYSLA
jgi:hypothetical protein